MRILVTGGTGLVGSCLLPRLRELGHDVLALSRRDRPSLPAGCLAIPGDPAVAGIWLEQIDSCDAVIHLAGENVFARRWRTHFKQQLYDSRIVSTRLIAERLARQPHRADGSPKVLVCASAVGYYGPREDEELVESDPAGSGFLAQICVDWEDACSTAREAGVRVANLRIGMVLDSHGGALKKLLLPFRLFLGGPVGNGKQWISWIHVADLVELTVFAMSNSRVAGPINATAPEPLTNWGFSKILGKVLHRPSWLPVPRWVLRILLGEAAGVVIRGQRVIPQQAVQAGFAFQFPDLEGALRQLLHRPLDL